MSNKYLFVVITVSDSCAADPKLDKSGPLLIKLILEKFQSVAQVQHCIVPDEQAQIELKLRQYVHDKAHLIITSGGTGFAPRDVTPEATKVLIKKECPQLSQFLASISLQKTPYAALSRGICGIVEQTLIVNLPGSPKAVSECFVALSEILPHALQLINDALPEVQSTHIQLQSAAAMDNNVTAQPARHICPHKTKDANNAHDRNSPFPMLEVEKAQTLIFDKLIPKRDAIFLITSPIDIPPFRASMKDGYAMQSGGFAGTKKVMGNIAAGDELHTASFDPDECFKINTGAPVPDYADCVVQIEDTKLLKTQRNGEEELVEVLVEPQPNLDIRPIGCDLRKGARLFPFADYSPVVQKSLLASIGKQSIDNQKLKICILSTGNELMQEGEKMDSQNCKIYDSNSVMLTELLKYFGFSASCYRVCNDNLVEVQNCIDFLLSNADFVICSGGVSMGDKDFIKPALTNLGYTIHFGRVNMKPGKPLTFATIDPSSGRSYFFGLPGNPVSAFVTFHLFVLPALRCITGVPKAKCTLPILSVKLQNDKIDLDVRPEYLRASLTSKDGCLYATVIGDQLSSRLQSIVGADVLLSLPAASAEKSAVIAGETLQALVLRYDFISKYN